MQYRGSLLAQKIVQYQPILVYQYLYTSVVQWWGSGLITKYSGRIGAAHRFYQNRCSSPSHQRCPGPSDNISLWINHCVHTCARANVIAMSRIDRSQRNCQAVKNVPLIRRLSDSSGQLSAGLCEENMVTKVVKVGLVWRISLCFQIIFVHFGVCRETCNQKLGIYQSC